MFQTYLKQMCRKLILHSKFPYTGFWNFARFRWLIRCQNGLWAIRYQRCLQEKFTHKLKNIITKKNSKGLFKKKLCSNIHLQICRFPQLQFRLLSIFFATQCTHKTTQKSTQEVRGCVDWQLNELKICSAISNRTYNREIGWCNPQFLASRQDYQVFFL